MTMTYLWGEIHCPLKGEFLPADVIGLDDEMLELMMKSYPT
jgi:hypothetical protein